ncbi:hypothetical protein [Sphaerisporangium fuscum]|uniref:hypothetical protein n=1 Tax=Sphaerisporangium fuscum TaxID=2835868 RepID=UPI001BDC4744|nr:hypothetical protein [Sphaerisporangium fuscum]
MKMKKVLTYGAIAFAVFYLYSRPTESATAVRSAVDGISSGAGQLATFVSQLVK